MINIPYTQMELDVALLCLSNKMEEKEELLESLVIEMEEKTGKTQAERNKKIAEFHGISVSDFLNSPNLTKLTEIFVQDLTFQLKDKLKEKMDISDKEAWAIITYVNKN